MKRFWKFILPLIALGCLVPGCAACQTSFPETEEPEQLAAPQDLKVFSNELSWSEVEHASGYIVKVDDATGTASSNFFSLPYFSETVTVELRVKACGDEINYTDSVWAELKYTYEKPTSGLLLTLLPDGEGYSVSKGIATVNGRVVIPDAYNNLPVLEIAYGAFDGHTKLTEVRLPEGLKKIEGGAFFRTGLTSVSIPDSVEFIGSGAFGSCPKLSELKLPKGIKRLAAGCFADAALTEVVIPEGCEYLEAAIFADCTKLERIEFPDSVMYMDGEVFHGTPWYEAQPEGFITVGRILYGYKGTIPANTVIDRLPEGVIAIAGKAFYQQTGLVGFSVDSLLLTIGEFAFWGCTNLIRVHLPDTITVLGAHLFRDCSSLSEFVIPQNLKKIDTYTFEACNSLNGIIIPKSVSKLSQSAFGRETKNLTLYMEAESCPELVGVQPNAKTPWHLWFPIIWGCELSERKDYVVSFLKREDRLENFGERKVYEPKRAGYRFCGWTTEQNGSTAQYSCETITEAPEGSRLYAVWQKL